MQECIITNSKDYRSGENTTSKMKKPMKATGKKPMNKNINENVHQSTSNEMMIRNL